MSRAEVALSLLEQPVFAFRASMFASGQPQNTPVWMTVVDGLTVSNTAVVSVLVRLIRLYPRLQGIHLRKLAPPRFAIGDRVAVSAPPTAPPAIHTRRPRYTWGKSGTVVGYHFATALPERSASGERGPNEHFYTVEFDGRELWGDGAEPGTAVRIDLFESYLEATS